MAQVTPPKRHRMNDRPIILEAESLVRFEIEEDASGQPTEKRILDDVGLSVREGEFLSIMGPSGSGKSTLLHCLSGLDQAQEGRVRLGAIELHAVPETERTLVRRRFLGFVFQFFNLLPDLTVRENIELPLLIAGERPEHHRDWIEELLEVFGIGRLGDRQPHSLSGGEMQRVSVARALSTRPSLLLADEPTGNLSSKAGAECMEHFLALRERYGIAILLVTHNPRDAAYGDRVLFLADGKLDPSSQLQGPDLDAAAVFSRLEELGI